MTLAADLNINLQRRAGLEGFDLVLRMAVGAGGRIAVTSRHGLAVHALFHVFGLLFVTPPARLRQPGKIQRRGRRRGRQDGVAVVTVLARRGIQPPLRPRQTVDAGAVALGLLLVALLAIGRLRRDVVIRVLRGDVGVAACAGVGLMDRSGELGHIHKERDLFAGGVGLGERLIPVALQAGAVLDRFGGGQSRQRPGHSKKCCSQETGRRSQDTHKG